MEEALARVSASGPRLVAFDGHLDVKEGRAWTRADLQLPSQPAVPTATVSPQPSPAAAESRSLQLCLHLISFLTQHSAPELFLYHRQLVLGHALSPFAWRSNYQRQMRISALDAAVGGWGVKGKVSLLLLLLSCTPFDPPATAF